MVNFATIVMKTFAHKSPVDNFFALYRALKSQNNKKLVSKTSKKRLFSVEMKSLSIGCLYTFMI